MNLYLRLLALWVRQLFAARREPLAPTCVRGRVWPNDLDLFGHVNNGRYLTLMDLGRLDFLFASDLVPVMRRRHWYGVASAVEIRFRRPLKLWRHYTLTTEVVDWDESWFVFEQRFEAAGKLVARALVQTQFRKGRERVPSAEVFAALALEPGAAPHGGEWVAHLAVNVQVEGSEK